MTIDVRPNQKQAAFMLDRHKIIAFGGARGGGKSWAVRKKAVLGALRYKGLKILIVRRTYPELRENHIVPLLAELRGVAKYNDKNKEFRFPNGSKIRFGYCANENDVFQYQGQEVDWLFLDEATQLTETQYIALTACVRGVNDFPKRIYVTCNPGGVGMAWVKRLFIDRRYNDGERAEDYSFIQSLVTDNVALMQSDPDYIRKLDALPEKLRRAWRYGDWNVWDGQFFEEFRDIPAHYTDRIGTHIIAPFRIPREWKMYRSFDFGYAKPFSCAWWAVDYDGRLYRILELYGCTAEANTGVKWAPDKIFTEIARMEREHSMLKGREIIGVADPSIWDGSRGESIAETAQRCGVYFTPGDNRRIPGWMQVHYRLAFDESGIPMMYVFNTCKGFIRTMPLLQYDAVRPEDLDTTGEDHIADEVRYMCMARPIKPVLGQIKKRPAFDPLDLWEE